MKPMNLKLGIVVAGLLLTAGPALAQRPSESGGGGAADRGTAGGGGGSVASGGGGSVAGGGSVSSGGSSGGGVSASSPSSGGMSSPSISMGDRAFRTTAPEHRVNFSDGQRAMPRSSESGPATAIGDRAIDRGIAAGNPGVSRRPNETTAPNNATGTHEVPNWSRPRGDRPATDVAVERVGPRPDRNGGGGYVRPSDNGYYGYYDPYRYGGFGYGFGLLYDASYGYPFLSPFGMGYGIPCGYFDPFYSNAYEYGEGFGAYSSRVYGGHDQGALKLKVKPRNAKVYVDGYYVGLVDEFDGAFQKLTLNGGRHKVELRAEGYETTEFDVLITPEQTISFAGDMKKVQ